MLGCCSSGMQILTVLHKTLLCLGSFSSTVTLKMKEAAITISQYQYCVIGIFTGCTCNAPTSARNVVHTWASSASMCLTFTLLSAAESGVCVTKSMGIKFIEQLRLLFCYCSAFTKDERNVLGCFNNSHRIAQHYHFVVYKGATGGIITNNFSL